MWDQLANAGDMTAVASSGVKAGSAAAPTGFSALLSSFGSNPLAGPILSGISSAIQARAARKEAEENRKHAVDQVRNTGDEQRRTALYTTLLGDWKERKDKFRKSQGLANYRAFASQPGVVKPGSHTERMLNFQSPNRVKDPGAAPDPQALHGQPEGNPRKGGYKPMYTITEDGRIESLNPNMRPKPSAIRPGG